MSADVLRKAAALMRERAEAAEKVHGSPWQSMGVGSVAYPMTKRILGTVAETFPRGGSVQQWDTTEHIASWHPAVALAVADWLELLAGWMDEGVGRLPATNIEDAWSDMQVAALAVARAYLGSES